MPCIVLISAGSRSKLNNAFEFFFSENDTSSSSERKHNEISIQLFFSTKDINDLLGCGTKISIAVEIIATAATIKKNALQIQREIFG